MADEPKISLEQARHVAKLARLELDEDKLRRFAGQIEHILEYVDQIARLDTSGVEPMAHALPQLHNVLREDEVGPSLPLEQVLANAPQTDGPFFKVPTVIGGGEEE